jgi:ribosome-associated protein
MPNRSNLEPALISILATNQVAPAEDDTLTLAQTIARAADERKGADIIILQVGEVSPLADYFVIVTGFSKVQVRAIARSIEEKVEQDLGRLPRRTEGQSEGSWVLQDYGDVIVHILMPREREFYNLEAFWGHAERVEFVGTEA